MKVKNLTSHLVARTRGVHLGFMARVFSNVLGLIGMFNKNVCVMSWSWFVRTQKRKASLQVLGSMKIGQSVTGHSVTQVDTSYSNLRKARIL